MRHLSLLLLALPGLAAAQPTSEPAAPSAPAPEPAPTPEPAPAPAPAPATTPPSGELTAAELGISDDDDLELPSSMGVDTSLKLYGFMDFAYFVPINIGNDLARAAIADENEFSVGHINLYAAKQISERFRTLLEVRFLFLPDGAYNLDTRVRTETNLQDTGPTGTESRVSWGGIYVERAQLDYHVRDGLQLRAGRWLTPYGIWNQDHGTPVLIGPWRPYAIGLRLIPEYQSGVMAFGTRPLGTLDLDYHLAVSNGRGPADAVRDLDANKALTARLALAGRGLGSWKIGASFYAGRFTDRDMPIPLPSGVVSEVRIQYDEVCAGLDVAWTYKRLELRGELLFQDVRFTDNGRPPANVSREIEGLNLVGSPYASPTDLVPDFRRYGGYVIVGYRFPWRDLTPFLHYERLQLGEVPFAEVWDHLEILGAGVNVHITPDVVLKVMAVDERANDAQVAEAQIAWTF